MLKHVTHGPCPKCGSRDNLATYPDGHQWCFGGCGLVTRALDDLRSRVEKRNEQRNQYASVANCPAIPKDCTPQLGSEGLRWIKSYGITDEELKRNTILWSDQRRQLVLPIFGKNGEGIVAWQARNFEPEAAAKRKYYNAGSPDTTLHVVRCTEPHRTDSSGELQSSPRLAIVLTEDLISAIKVARYCDASPIFGSNVSEARLNVLREHYKEVLVWLDYDKRKEARGAVNRALRVGLSSRAITTKLDPKELSDQEIIKELQNGT